MTGLSLAASLRAIRSLDHAVRTADAQGTAVDIRTAHTAAGYFTTENWTDGDHTPTLQHSPDGQAGWVDVPASDLVTQPVTVSAAAGEGVQIVEYKGNLGYLRCAQAVAGGPATGALMGGSILIGRERYKNAPGPKGDVLDLTP